MNLEETIENAKKIGSYFITVSSFDKTKEENNINHYVFRNDFSASDIVPSLDSCVKSLNIKLEKPTDVINPPKIKDKVEPLKIAIISHFNSCPQSYSPARAVRNQIKMLTEHGHDVTFFLTEGSKLNEEDFGCKLLKVIPRFKREKMVVNEEIKDRLINIFKETLEGKFDIAITHDFFIQDTVTFSEAIRQSKVKIPWLHFARSGIGHNMDFSMPNAKFVYLNKSDVGRFARAIKVPVEQCRSVYNEKELSYMFKFDPITRMIINKYELWNRDIIQTYPMCSTRLDAKGLNHVIRLFVELKRLGKKVMLIVANSNGRKRVDDLKRKQELANELGLNNDEFIFTSLLADDQYPIYSEVPNKVCAELMQVSNLFAFASIAEVGPNVLLEAAMTKNLIVANSDLPLIYDFVDKNKVLSFPFTSNQSLHYMSQDNNLLKDMAEKIVKEIDNNKSDLTFRQVWKNHNSEAIYGMLIDVIVESINDFKK